MAVLATTIPAVTPPYVPGAGAPAVRGVAIQSNGAAGYVLDALGGIHPFSIAGGVALKVSGAPTWLPGSPLARNLAL